MRGSPRGRISGDFCDFPSLITRGRCLFQIMICRTVRGGERKTPSTTSWSPSLKDGGFRYHRFGYIKYKIIQCFQGICGIFLSAVGGTNKPPSPREGDRLRWMRRSLFRRVKPFRKSLQKPCYLRVCDLLIRLVFDDPPSPLGKANYPPQTVR